jgi:hypothetical protein
MLTRHVDMLQWQRKFGLKSRLEKFVCICEAIVGDVDTFQYAVALKTRCQSRGELIPEFHSFQHEFLHLSVATHRFGRLQQQSRLDV